jgi:hypothetical protein
MRLHHLAPEFPQYQITDSRVHLFLRIVKSSQSVIGKSIFQIAALVSFTGFAKIMSVCAVSVCTMSVYHAEKMNFLIFAKFD